MLHRLEGLTGVNTKTIPFDDIETMNLIKNVNTLGINLLGCNYVKDIIIETKPSDFEDLVKIIGLAYGTDVWKNNAQDLIKNGTITLKEVIANRDDIMIYLVYLGIDDKTAFDVMEFIRKGRFAIDGWNSSIWEKDRKIYEDIMKKYNVPEWYIDACKKIRYLFPKAHAVNYVMNSFRIAYYKIHYPKEFYKTYFEVKASEEFDFTIVNDKEKLLKTIEELKERTINNENELDYNMHFLKKDYEVALEMNNKGIKI